MNDIIKRFAFNLETVLQYRTRKEEEAVTEQAGAEARRRQKEGALARTRATLDESLAAGPDARPGYPHPPSAGTRVGVAELLHTSVYHVHLNLLAVRQAAEVEEAAREWALCRERTLVLHRERQVLEKLKERRKDEFFHQLGLQEQKENDEISLRLHTARQNGH